MAKKPSPTSGRTPECELGDAVDRLTGTLAAVHDLMARIHDAFTWIINNRGEFLQSKAEESVFVIEPIEPVPTRNAEIISCSDCNTSSPPSLAAALQQGWTGLAAHPVERGNYVGLCPDCLEGTSTSSCPFPLSPQEESVAIPAEGLSQPKHSFRLMDDQVP